ncbi:MAG: hypothetical protein RMX96_26110 [Nostoc sp. ChiSLP02]|nr:hypothetical protein [Nostoc sp. DedSLP05]MDZ8101169.1 hypothetical protein [Nostoc sp. DedSLP01]MDZ8188317.1 hypothetical protein [Nostoc sp. ChiSLP02]
MNNMRHNKYDYSELVRIIDLFLESQYGEVWHRFCEGYIQQRDNYDIDDELPKEENQEPDEHQEGN